jgi:hypothetical protein
MKSLKSYSLNKLGYHGRQRRSVAIRRVVVRWDIEIRTAGDTGRRSSRNILANVEESADRKGAWG